VVLHAVFQYLTTSEEAVSLAEQTISFLPGVVLALALMLSGHAIAAPLHRIREWLHALRDRRPGLSLLGSLALPVLYLAAVLSTVAVWALLRARDTGTEEVDGARYAPGWVAVLMLVLAITAVAMKVVAHNPYAESAAEARRGLLRARLTYAWLVRRFGDALREHEPAWSDLCAVRDELASQVRLESMRVWEAPSSQPVCSTVRPAASRPRRPSRRAERRRRRRQPRGWRRSSPA
jgi:hypothetical protein